MIAQWTVPLISLWLLAPPNGSPFPGVVTHVLDGDSITVLAEKKLIKVRLANIFAPQLGQPFAGRSRRGLEALALHQRVKVHPELTDRYNRVVAEVQLEDGPWLEDEMVAAGLAWHYRVARPFKSHLAKLEHLAFSTKLGLWMQRHPVPPWEYTREDKIPPPPSNTDTMDYDRIFHYGLIGDQKTRTYRWPACRGYAMTDFSRSVVFLN
ncbi:MAG: thermonuclease family protein, partial [Nitrospinaceae bacterium]